MPRPGRATETEIERVGGGLRANAWARVPLNMPLRQAAASRAPHEWRHTTVAAPLRRDADSIQCITQAAERQSPKHFRMRLRAVLHIGGRWFSLTYLADSR